MPSVNKTTSQRSNDSNGKLDSKINELKHKASLQDTPSPTTSLSDYIRDKSDSLSIASHHSQTGLSNLDSSHQYTLRVINPDLFNEASEPVHTVNSHYKPMLASSISTTPEIRHAEIVSNGPENSKLVGIPPVSAPSSYHSNHDEILSDSCTTSPASLPAIDCKYNTLLESTKEKQTNEEHSLSPLEMPSLLSQTNQKIESPAPSYHSVSPSLGITTENLQQPPSLPMHLESVSSPSKGSPSVAQQSVAAIMINSGVSEEIRLSSPESIHLPEWIPSPSQEILTVAQPQQPQQQQQKIQNPQIVYNYNTSQPERTSHELLRDQRQNITPKPSFENRSKLTTHSRNPSLTPSNFTDNSIGVPISNRHTRASYSLTNHPDAIKLYRTMALKTRDPQVQLTYAKYLLEISGSYGPKDQKVNFKPAISLSLPLLKRPNSRNRRDSTASGTSSLDSRTSAQTSYFADVLKQESPEEQNPEEVTDVKKKKELEEEGVRWIKKLAKQNIGEAAYLLALWHQRGLYGCRKSESRALKFYEIAANQKVPEAMYAVAQYSESERDYMTSFRLYEEAANLGLVEALYRIALINLNAEFGSRRNIPAAVQLLMKATEMTTGSCPEAPYTLGLLLASDHPSVEAPAELIQSLGGTFAATTYFESAAEMGMPLAQYRLGYMNEHGMNGLRINLQKAYKYYELAANGEDAHAMLGLSRLCNHAAQAPPEQQEKQLLSFQNDESGWLKTHVRDPEAAFRWCRMAAYKHLPEAYYLLGWYFENGIGIEQDYRQAQYYYSKASKGGYKDATSRIQAISGLAKQQKKSDHRQTMINPQEKKPKESQCTIM
ncbi:hypothetical protein K501DRAFT_205153 [Backusella circina FSU 941]|nr:hypothetical protein K501DRAFT_205153 [Backusella circina FSU 941]